MDADNARGDSATAHSGSDGAKPASTFETRCYEKVLGEKQFQSSALFRDAELVDSPKEAKTFWLPADASPTTSLELLAKAIFDFHAESGPQQHPRAAEGKNSTTRLDGDGIPGTAADPHPSNAERGAEWWVQRREEGHHENLGMPFHWDKDELMLDQKGTVLTPAVSTVTYLTDHGAPTVVLESRVSDRGAVDDGGIKRAFVSYPELFKHLAFDGGFLHGVPEQLMRAEDKCEGDRPSSSHVEEGNSTQHIRNSAAPSSVGSVRRKRGRMRVTLLVNVWLSHRPEGVAPLPADLAATLSSTGASTSPLLCFGRPVAFFPVPIGEENGAALVRPQEADMASVRATEGSTMVIDAPLGPTVSLELRVPTPRRLSAGRLKAQQSFALFYREASLSRISTRRGEEAGGAARVEHSAILEGSTNEDIAEGRGGGIVEGGIGREVDKAAERTSRKRKK